MQCPLQKVQAAVTSPPEAGAVFAVADPVGGDVAGVAHRQAVIVGGAPSSSTISKAAVFCPCSRKGLTELTMVTGASLATSFTRRMPSSKLPLIWITTEPCIMAWASLPMAILPSGMSTKAVMPARAA
jgi:hypothetical protein